MVIFVLSFPSSKAFLVILYFGAVGDKNRLYTMDLWDDLFSDDDEDIIMYISRRTKHQCTGTSALFPRSTLFDDLAEDTFVERFRLSKATTLILLQQIETRLKYRITRVTAVTPINQLLCTLRFYATGSHLITCGAMIGVHESTACRIVHRVTQAIVSLGHKYIKFPTTEEQLNQIAKEFHKIAKFPNVIGAIDCMHVKILSPGGKYAEIYRNSKRYFSIKTQCVAAANLQFVNVEARWHGSAPDSIIWDHCALMQNFVGKYPNKHLVGHGGYAQTKFMMTPLPDGSPSTRAEHLYQESQIQTRNVVERAFEVWKRRFPILCRGIDVHLHRVPGIIMATAILHNLAIEQNEVEPPEDPEYPMIQDTSIDSITTVAGRHQRSENAERRMLIENYFEFL